MNTQATGKICPNSPDPFTALPFASLLSLEKLEKLAAEFNADSNAAANHRAILAILVQDSDHLQAGLIDRPDTAQTIITGIGQYQDFLYAMAEMAELAMVRIEAVLPDFDSQTAGNKKPA